MKIISNELDLIKKILNTHWNVRKKRFTIIWNQINKIPVPDNAREHYESYLNRKNIKLVKRSEIITQQPKLTENSNIIDLKSVTIEHPKNVGQGKKVGSGGNGSKIQKTWNFFLWKKQI